ncbi:hypothetical protein AVEN_204477-1 [Araneus ventricosus]|uniref:HTH CENPB-type domain-containing protein n=1 Tax=Araneus ventricosus TaxID=182803 RepID=A0A4Y2P7U8_ARAVE|nr:hypothetical protein AVEN_141542-1 [Araneus ventricosus]GBN47123.1 hypothetical protein AVEN_204477-1 [Araneus ventricosus]
MKIADVLGRKDFYASSSWLDKFQVRNNVVFRALCGEAADVDDNLCEDWTTRLPLLLAGYADKDIFNMNETERRFFERRLNGFFSCPPK